MILLAALALAAPTYTDHGPVLSAPGSGPFAGGVNAPAVEWDGAAGLYVMFFESPAASADVPDDCYSYYRLGRATSPDGSTWTIDDSFVLEPDHADESGTYRCAATQPALAYDGTTWHLLFTGGTTDEGKGRNEPAGILHATSPDGIDWVVDDAPAVPPEANGIGLASAVIVDGTVYVLYSQLPHLRLATAPAGGGAWTLHPDPVVDNSTLGDWASTWVFGPSLGCADEASPRFNLTLGGDSTSGARTLAIGGSDDAIAWSIEQPVVVAALDSNGINHWDVLPVGVDAWRLWYSRTDDLTGLKGVGLAEAGTESHRRGRSCPDPWPPPTDTGDTGAPNDTGSPVDSAAPADTSGTTDTAADAAAAPSGCGCSVPGDGGIACFLVATAGLLGRRRAPAAGPD